MIHTYTSPCRLHPLSILVASHVYKLGKGEKGKLSWVPIPGIVDALEEAFLASIKVPTDYTLLPQDFHETIQY